jgi:hypothetical protein
VTTVSTSIRGLWGIGALGEAGHDVLRLDGQSSRCRKSGVEAGSFRACNVFLNGGAGNDTLSLRARFRPRDNLFVALNGGPGDDTISIGVAAITSDFRRLRIDCGGGTDTLVIPARLDLERASSRLPEITGDDAVSSCENVVRTP